MGFIIDFTKEKLSSLVNLIQDILDCGPYWASIAIFTSVVVPLAHADVWIIYESLHLFDRSSFARWFSKQLSTASIASLISGVSTFENAENGFKFRREYQRKEFAVAFLIVGITTINILSKVIVETYTPDNIVVIPHLGISLLVGYVLVHTIEGHYDITNELAPLLVGILVSSLLFI